uniref:Uncharacterized protein n=1 Tax=Arundo donax TaxID=35708 RepID=A0A0A8ZLQ5_ARUDO
MLCDSDLQEMMLLSLPCIFGR